MITLSKGIKTPESGDKGAVVFSALNSNFTIQNNHAHNGLDSALIPSESIAKQAINLPTGSWVAGPRGFSQTVTCPGTVTLDKVALRFRVRTGAFQHQFINPTVEPTSLTSFVVIVNNSSLDLEVIFV